MELAYKIKRLLYQKTLVMLAAKINSSTPQVHHGASERALVVNAMERITTLVVFLGLGPSSLIAAIVILVKLMKFSSNSHGLEVGRQSLNYYRKFISSCTIVNPIAIVKELNEMRTRTELSRPMHAPRKSG